MKVRHSHGGARNVGIALIAIALVACAFGGAGRALAQTPADKHRFDIPAQSLVSALAQFATASGVDIAYGQSLATGRRSHPVHGEHPAPVGLQMLLQGTGLAARFTGPRAAIIYQPALIDAPASRLGGSAERPLRLNMAEVRAPIMVGAGDRNSHQRYALAVQSEVRELLRTDGDYEGRTFRLEVRLAVDQKGAIRKVTIRRPSSEPAWDRHVVVALTGHSLSNAPPADLLDPLIFEIVSNHPAGRTTFREERR